MTELNTVFGLVTSSFDLLHAGHIMMLREAKHQCDYLIAALQTDPTLDRPEKNKPVQTVVERYIQLSAVKYVDEIVVYETEADLEDIINMYPITVRILGVEYRDKDFTGRETCKKRGIRLHFNSRDHRFSSSDLRKRVAIQEQAKKRLTVPKN
ncbi:MAG: adenylyltransferase/cytidyltransferase family protein [Anaerolineaceae bacterium]